ncbi:DNA damage-induced apoptosis suppressor protein [Channa argus]|uniref:DNA damage-induced apoptosis suppressor protein n=1 Tax=Channa argus TaxID=215402 RepID=UPI0029467A09|nr:hypothetical protein Q8A73_002575 [Channa argus]
MSVKRVLVDCAVLSLLDSRVYYPSCKCCFSRIDVEQQDSTRCRCSKCGYSCLRKQVDYRYRLSLRVARDTCIFGVTVFGTCLNPFFGIPASGLKRLVDSSDGPDGASTRSTLLLKSVEHCFIGRHFIFGIKVTGGEGGLWSGGPVANGSCGKDTVQFTASQMILPKATELTGCTVVSYYRILLQKAEAHELGSTDTNKTSRPPATTLLLIPHPSPPSSFNNSTHSTLSLLSQSLQRSQYQNCTLIPTPPWEQSLGLITSSAEQEEGCSTKDSGNENSRWSDNKVECQTLKGCLENHQLEDEAALSPLLSYNSPSFARYPYSPIEKPVVNTPILNNRFSPSQSADKKNLPLTSNLKELSRTELIKTFLAWDDLPFSESLTEFLCEKDEGSDDSAETETHPHVQNRTERARSYPETLSKDRNLATESNSICQSSAQITARQSQLLLDFTNIPPSNNKGERHDLYDRVCTNPVGYVKKSKARSICSHDCNQNKEEVGSLFRSEKQPEGDTYNCSADLFSGSLMISMNTSASSQTETVRTAAEACATLSNETPNALHFTPRKQTLESNKCLNEDSLISPSTQDLDFVPSSQSTPYVELAVRSRSPASSYSTFSSDSEKLSAFCGNRPKSGRKTPAKITSSVCKVNTFNSNHLSQCAREFAKENFVLSTLSGVRSQRFTPKRKFWKSKKRPNYLLAQQCLRVQRGALNLGSTEETTHERDSSVCDVTACDYGDSEVPPTPAAKTLRTRWTDSSCGSSNSTWEGQQGGGVMCKRTLLHPALTSSRSAVTQTGDSVGSDSDVLDDHIQACDWSRDLFTDSIC